LNCNGNQLFFPCLGKGGKNYKKGKKRDEGETRRELIFKEDGQEYAQVQKMLGKLCTSPTYPCK
jgi:hypothetical protein